MLMKKEYNKELKYIRKNTDEEIDLMEINSNCMVCLCARDNGLPYISTSLRSTNGTVIYCDEI